LQGKLKAADAAIAEREKAAVALRTAIEKEDQFCRLDLSKRVRDMTGL
jgi:hypothetical protein